MRTVKVISMCIHTNTHTHMHNLMHTTMHVLRTPNVIFSSEKEGNRWCVPELINPFKKLINTLKLSGSSTCVTFWNAIIYLPLSGFSEFYVYNCPYFFTNFINEFIKNTAVKCCGWHVKLLLTSANSFQ
jgi:hypothetical protein